MTMNSRTSLIYTAVILCLSIGVRSVPTHSHIFLSARVGSSAVLPCDWRNLSTQNPHIEWRTISETIFERKGHEQYQSEGYEDCADVPEDKLLKGNCSLLLKNITPDDAGLYESYLVVKRVKRSLRSKRVLVQTVELSVDETPQEIFSINLAAKDGAGMNRLHLQIILFPLVLCLLHLF